MNNDQILDLLFSDPEKVFSIVKNNGGNLNHIKKLELGKLFVKEGFPNLSNKKHEEAIDFLFWFIYGVEKEIEDGIQFVEKKLGRDDIEIEELIQSLTFGNKIVYIERNYIDKGKDDVYIPYMRSLNKLRNHMSHGRLDELEYGGYFLSEPEGQLKIISDFRNASLNKKLVR